MQSYFSYTIANNCDDKSFDRSVKKMLTSVHDHSIPLEERENAAKVLHSIGEKQRRREDKYEAKRAERKAKKLKIAR